MQPTTTTEATDPIATHTPEPAPAAPTATPAPAEPATADQVGEPTAEEVAEALASVALHQPTAEEVESGPSPLAAACAAGAVKLFRLRGTGTTRRLMWLAGEAREVAEWYALQLDQGVTVRSLAEACETSKATVRRALSTLALMEEITDGLHDDLYAEDVTEIVFGAEEDGDE